MNRLAIFDIDGTITDTNGVDDDCYRAAVANALEVPASVIDWSGALHVTDSEIFRWLSTVHGREEPTLTAIARARSHFVQSLTEKLRNEPERFTAVAGAADMLRHLADAGWRVSFATGGWGPSARLKLKAAGIAFDDTLFACADDAASRAEIVQLARKRAELFYKCEFERVVTVGDGVWDVHTAATLSLPFIGIGEGERAERLRGAGAEVIFANYLDVVQFVNALVSATPPSASP